MEYILSRTAECCRILPPEVVAAISGLFELHEIEAAIIALNRGKSPGPSGIPAELYQLHPELWAVLLTPQFNACFLARTGLSKMQRSGRVAMLFKAGRRASLKNWRPISNLQKDFQILSGALNVRIGNVVSMLTAVDQTGFTAGRFMYENILKWSDASYYARQAGIPCAKAAYDWSKAYDNVSHPFLFAVVDLMTGIPLELVLEDLRGSLAALEAGTGYAYRHSSNLTRWIQVLYCDHMRCVTVNGTTTQFFKLMTSCPQGCISAPRIFVLFIEPLGILFRTDPGLKGVVLPSGNQVLTMRFADDCGNFHTAPTIDELSQTIGRGLTVVEIFGAGSGMLNNSDKVEAMYDGLLALLTTPWEHGSFDGERTVHGALPRMPWKRSGDFIKLLGIRGGYNLKAEDEWTKVAVAMLTILRMWSAVPLDICARGDVAKMLVWSKAWFLATYVEMPPRFYKTVWAATKYYVVKGFLPKGVSLENTSSLRTRHSELDLRRRIKYGGRDLWLPSDQMVAQDVKLIRDLLSTDEPYAVRESATFPSITHAGWREVPTLLVDRLNWHGEKRAVASTEAVQCCVPAVTNVQIGDDAVVVTKHGRHVITITAEHTVTDFMVTVPGIDRDPANKMWCDRLHVPRGLVALIEGVDIAQELRKKLDLPAGWLKVLRHYARLHHTAHIRLPATAEECLSMPIFGSPHILLDDSQLHPFSPTSPQNRTRVCAGCAARGPACGRLDATICKQCQQPFPDWSMWVALGITHVHHLWDCSRDGWRSAKSVLHGNTPMPAILTFDPSQLAFFESQLTRVQRAIPALWQQLLHTGRQPPLEGDWIAECAGPLNQTLCLVHDVRGTGPLANGWLQVMVTRHPYSELTRTFTPAETQTVIGWHANCWDTAHVEFSPTARKKLGILYGWTHETFAQHPRRVEWWKNLGDERPSCTLETYSVRQGRDILAPAANVMMPAAAALYDGLRGSSTPPLTFAFTQLWKLNTWDGPAREYAWKLATQTVYCGTFARNGDGDGVRLPCSLCQTGAIDSAFHRVHECRLTQVAWKWARRVLGVLGVGPQDYGADRTGAFMLYGATPFVMPYPVIDEVRVVRARRVVSVLRGTFFTAHRRIASGRAFAPGLDEDERAAAAAAARTTLPVETLARQMRHEMQREMLLDYIHGGGDFQRSFGFGAAPESVRPRDHIEFKQAWGQLFTKYNDAAHTIQDGLPRIYPEPD